MSPAADATETRYSYDSASMTPRMKKALVASVIFHILLIIFCIVGLPMFHHKIPDTQMVMSVELMKTAAV